MRASDRKLELADTRVKLMLSAGEETIYTLRFCEHGATLFGRDCERLSCDDTVE